MLAVTPMKDSLTTPKMCTYYNNEDFIRKPIKSDFHMFHKNWILAAHWIWFCSIMESTFVNIKTVKDYILSFLGLGSWRQCVSWSENKFLSTITQIDYYLTKFCQSIIVWTLLVYLDNTAFAKTLLFGGSFFSDKNKEAFIKKTKPTTAG